MHPLRDPILLLPWVCFRVAAFQTLNLTRGPTLGLVGSTGDVACSTCTARCNGWRGEASGGGGTSLSESVVEIESVGSESTTTTTTRGEDSALGSSGVAGWGWGWAGCGVVFWALRRSHTQIPMALGQSARKNPT
jgi:hypothetical protein